MLHARMHDDRVQDVSGPDESGPDAGGQGEVGLCWWCHQPEPHQDGNLYPGGPGEILTSYQVRSWKPREKKFVLLLFTWSLLL